VQPHVEVRTAARPIAGGGVAEPAAAGGGDASLEAAVTVARRAVAQPSARAALADR
jgi:hypothetical protein